jgi:anthranilate synthase component 2
MILIIDNYDSFTYNLFQMIGEIIQELSEDSREFLSEIKVIRNDELNLSQISDLNPHRIIISPGPGNPINERDFGICRDVIEKLGSKIPVLGVCLGHQGIFSTFGGKIIKEEPVHGKQSEIFHDGKGLFEGVSRPLIAARYHSLICDPQSTPEFVEITSRTKNNIIMSLKHKDYPIFGLQFHPESIGTSEGKKIVKNFLVME